MISKFPPQFNIFFLVILFLAPLLSFSQGDLMIMPKRLVFDGSQRSQEINLANTGNDTATYAISFVQYKMTEQGSFEEITEPELGQRFATDFLRYFPRRVTLAPNEAQSIRVQLTRTGNLEPGEYRSHIYFRAVEEQTALGLEEKNESDGISISINTVFGISIPVIIRHGNSTTELELKEVSLTFEEDRPVLSMSLNRKGNMSVYGDLIVEHIAPEGVVTEVGMVKGLSVYTPNEKRFFTLGLEAPEGLDFSNGKLRIVYSMDGGKILASTEKQL